MPKKARRSLLPEIAGSVMLNREPKQLTVLLNPHPYPLSLCPASAKAAVGKRGEGDIVYRQFYFFPKKGAAEICYNSRSVNEP